MATTAGTANELVQRRIYAYGGISHTDAFVISILSLCQRVYNAFARKVLDSTSLTVTAATPYFYLRNVASEAVDIITVTESVSGTLYELARVWSPTGLAGYDADWFGNVTATRYHAWFQSGRDMIFIHPTKSSDGIVSLNYSKLTDALSLTTDVFEVGDEDVSAILDLTEIILLARDKQLTTCAEKMQQFMEHVGIDSKEKPG